MHALMLIASALRCYATIHSEKLTFARRQCPHIGERTKLTTRQERIDDFIHEGSPPNDQPLQILCEDHVGTYVIPFPCRWRDGIWENAKTSRRIEATVVGWRALNKTQR